jgi:hypothetical protein
MDVVSSRPVDMAISGPLTAQGNENGMEIKMDGKMSIAIKGNIAGGSGPAPRIEDVTNDIRNDGNNGAAGFAGTFTDNNKVTVELQQSGNGWTGSLRNGDKTFPIESASVNGNQISGKFNAGGKSFDFNGTLNGNALTFKTGNSSYNLQRQADSVSDNPFN